MFHIEWLQYVEDNWVYDTANCFLIGCRLLGSTSLPHNLRGLVQPAIYVEHQVADLPGCICVFYHVAEVEKSLSLDAFSHIFPYMRSSRACFSAGWGGFQPRIERNNRRPFDHGFHRFHGFLKRRSLRSSIRSTSLRQIS